MPIGASDGTLDIENATLRSNAIVVLTNLVTGNDVVRSLDPPNLEVYGDPSQGGTEPTLELVSNVDAGSTSAFTRLTSNAGVFSIQSGTDNTVDSKGDIVFSSIGGDSEHMRIVGSTGRVVIGNVDVSANLHMTTASSVLVDSNVVTEYTGPHDRPLRKYPEVALTTTSETSSGYKGYKVSTSSQLTNYEGYHAFDKTGWETPASENNNAWVSGGSKYVAATGAPDTGAATTSYVGGTATGEYVQLQLPRKIKISKYDYTPRTHTGNDEGKSAPKTVKLLGSNNGSTWTLIKDITHLGTRPEEGVFYTAQVGATEYYDYIRFVATSTYSDGTSPTFTDVRLSQIRFYGHEEGSGSLDTTLKSVYNVPATTGTQLEVYYDGQNYTSGTTVNDLALPANNATISNSGSTITFDSTYKAWTFGGSSGRTDTFRSSSLPSTFTGNQVHSITLWFNMSNISDGSIFVITPSGGENGGDVIMGQTQGDGARISYSFWGNDVSFDLPTNLATGSWYHLSMTYDATDNSTGRKMFLNGIECTAINTASGSLSLPNSNMIISFANRVSQTTYPFFGSIANFRLYSKALNADQVKELYEYQKDYFLGSKSQVTLYKGNLGVGVAEPSGQLELAGDERIQEYPPRGMTNPSTYIEGHGVFKAYGFQPNASYPAWQAFDHTGNLSSVWYSDSLSEFTGTGEYNGSIQLAPGTPKGPYIVLEMPYEIVLKQIKFWQQFNGSHVWDRGVYYAKCNPSDEWTVIHNVTDRPANDDTPYVAYITDSRPYKYFAIVITRRHTAHATNGVSIRDLQFFGTPGPTTLDKGSLSLTRSLDVPRVSRYDVDTETPRPEKLVVDFDTTVNESPTDISGQGNHGTMVGATYSPADKAFSFDGTDDYIEAVTNLGSGNRTLCFSMWIKPETDNRWFIDLGKNTATGGSFFAIRYDTYYQFNVKNGNHIHISAGPLNTWEHLVIIYHGTGSTKTAGTIEGYVNGVLANLIASDFADDQLNLSANPPIEIGARTSASNTYFDGQISNFKLYDVALEPSEVRKLYNLGRTGRSMVISDTAVGIGKVPEAQLDVRGVVRSDGILMKYDGNITHVRDGGIMLSRAGLGTATNDYSSQPIIFDGGDSGAGNDTNLRGGAIWSQWGGSQYGLAFRGANYDDAYPYLESPAMFVTKDKVGIGTNSPYAKLHVVGNSGSISSGTHYGFQYNTTIASYTGVHSGISIYADDDIVAGNWVLSHAGTMGSSDERIKKEIVDVEDGQALSTLRLLKPKQYKYRDDVKRGTEPVWGFIAQEVADTIPYATQKRTECIPNIYETVNVSASNVITFTNFNTINLESNTTSRLKLYDSKKNEHMVKLVSILGEHIIQVEEDLTNWTGSFDESNTEGNQIFVYGEEVNDFHFLNKNAIWTIATAALQEVDRQLQAEQVKVATLETQLTSVLARLDALESA